MMHGYPFVERTADGVRLVAADVVDELSPGQAVELAARLLATADEVTRHPVNRTPYPEHPAAAEHRDRSVSLDRRTGILDVRRDASTLRAAAVGRVALEAASRHGGRAIGDALRRMAGEIDKLAERDDHVIAWHTLTVDTVVDDNLDALAFRLSVITAPNEPGDLWRGLKQALADAANDRRRFLAARRPEPSKEPTALEVAALLAEANATDPDA